MATARAQIAPPGQLGHYHCTIRCVQQMFLCGIDHTTGKNFDHRRQWIEDRIFELANVFAVSIHAYAVMSNHYHLVLTIDPDYVAEWDDLEIAQRGVMLHQRADETEEQQLARVLVWRDTPAQIAKLRQRLGSLSEFMKALNESIAKRANKESGKSGNFWQDRFHCQSLEDDAAILAVMAYVDLNPVRATMAESLAHSQHTSAKLRLEQISADRQRATDSLLPIAGLKHRPILDMTAIAYLDLVEQTGRAVHQGKRGTIAASSLPVLRQFGLSGDQWQIQVLGIGSRYWRAVGCVDSLLQLAERLGQQWVRGLVGARELERNA